MSQWLKACAELRAQQAAPSPIDLAWEAINALGGLARPNDEFDRGFVSAIDLALKEIEKLGGTDPLTKTAGKE